MCMVALYRRSDGEWVREKAGYFVDPSDGMCDAAPSGCLLLHDIFTQPATEHRAKERRPATAVQLKAFHRNTSSDSLTPTESVAQTHPPICSFTH